MLLKMAANEQFKTDDPGSQTDAALLSEFLATRSQEAFTTLVQRHLNLVYSAASRQVRSPHLAEEVSQTVFTTLARNAARLAADPELVLSAWLYQVARHAAIDLIRREAARQAREQLAFQMSAFNPANSESTPAWNEIEPLLDEAMEALDIPDRTALLLRYFENKSLREVGEVLGASEDAAQKRVSRAVDRLREHFEKRKVTVGAAALTALLSANAIQAAPSALALNIASASLAGLGAISTTAVATATATAGTAATAATSLSKTIAITMTATQKTVALAIVAAGAIAFGIYEAHTTSTLRTQVESLQRQQNLQQAAASNEALQLQAERDQARKQVATLTAEAAAKAKGPNETLQLKGEVSRLRQESKQLGATSGLSRATADPEARRIMREQQKMGMNMIYARLGKDLKLTKEQSGKLDDLLADHIMEDVERVTVALRDKHSPEEINQAFIASDAALQTKVQELLGDDGLTKYQDYTKNLFSELSAQQFKAMMEGDEKAKEEKVKKIAQILSEETQAALAKAGLPADYQMIPMLNFRNIASEKEADRSLQLVDNIYNAGAARLGGILSPEELKKLDEFKSTAINNNRSALKLNRNLMMPIGN